MLLYEDKIFKIMRDNRDYILIRKNLPYSHHAHFRKLSGAKLIITLFNKQIIPRRRYFIESMRRITTEDEYLTFRKQKTKQKYYNKQQ